MTTFVDTSAMLALLDCAENRHEAAWRAFNSLVNSGWELVTSSFVLVETYALVQSRLGMDAVRTLHEELLPLLSVHWVEDSVFTKSAAALLVADRRQLSLVDCTSFVLMRQLGIGHAFAFDDHFREQGFKVEI